MERRRELPRPPPSLQVGSVSPGQPVPPRPARGYMLNRAPTRGPVRPDRAGGSSLRKHTSKGSVAAAVDAGGLPARPVRGCAHPGGRAVGPAGRLGRPRAVHDQPAGRLEREPARRGAPGKRSAGRGDAPDGRRHQRTDRVRSGRRLAGAADALRDGGAPRAVRRPGRPPAVGGCAPRGAAGGPPGLRVLQEGAATVAGLPAYYIYTVANAPARPVSLYAVMVFMAVGQTGFYAYGATVNDPDRIRTDFATISAILETFRPAPPLVQRPPQPPLESAPPGAGAENPLAGVFMVFAVPRVPQRVLRRRRRDGVLHLRRTARR